MIKNIVFDISNVLAPFRFKEFLAEKDSIKVEIVAANYGTNDKRVDVLDKLNKYFDGTRLLQLPRYNTAFGDPTPNEKKTLRIAYRINGGDVKNVTFNENVRVVLPKP